MASAICAVVWSVVVLWAHQPPARPRVEGKFEVHKGEVSTHTPGKVKLIEFADFYCPHCHHFEEAALPILQKEFGNKLKQPWSGFPVSEQISDPFYMYEQGR